MISAIAWSIGSRSRISPPSLSRVEKAHGGAGWGGAETDGSHDLRDRMVDRLAFEDLADFDEPRRERERADVAERLVEAVEEEQQKVRDRRDRSAHVAPRADARL